jgi:hypothetical protein
VFFEAVLNSYDTSPVLVVTLTEFSFQISLPARMIFVEYDVAMGLTLSMPMSQISDI